VSGSDHDHDVEPAVGHQEGSNLFTEAEVSEMACQTVQRGAQFQVCEKRVEVATLLEEVRGQVEVEVTETPEGACLL
jgi:hypothetical protein